MSFHPPLRFRSKRLLAESRCFEKIEQKPIFFVSSQQKHESAETIFFPTSGKLRGASFRSFFNRNNNVDPKCWNLERPVVYFGTTRPHPTPIPVPYGFIRSLEWERFSLDGCRGVDYFGQYICRAICPSIPLELSHKCEN